MKNCIKEFVDWYKELFLGKKIFYPICLFFMILGGFVVIGFVVNYFMIIKSPIGIRVAQNNDWIGFWGGIIGSVISGLITFVVLKVTLDADKKANNTPILVYNVDCGNNFTNRNCMEVRPRDFNAVWISMDQDYKEVDIYLEVKNIGRGVAQNIRVKNTNVHTRNIIDNTEYSYEVDDYIFEHMYTDKTIDYILSASDLVIKIRLFIKPFRDEIRGNRIGINIEYTDIYGEIYGLEVKLFEFPGIIEKVH